MDKGSIPAYEDFDNSGKQQDNSEKVLAMDYNNKNRSALL